MTEFTVSHRDGIGANTHDMRRTADELSRTNGELRAIAGDARGAALSGALLRSAILSPASAAKAEAELIEAAAVISGLTLRVDALALVLRTRANLFELADAGGELFMATTSMVLWPAALAVDVAAFAGFGPAKDLLRAFPQITDVGTSGLMHFVATGGVRRPPLPGDYDRALAMLQGLAWLGGRWQGGPITLRNEKPIDGTQVATLADVVGGGVDIEGDAGRDREASAVRVVKIDHPGGARWIVEIPGTDFAGTEHDPSNAGANLSLMRGQDDELLHAVREAMRRSGVNPGDPVLVTGHSQGGIAAMALARHPGPYTITDVVTTGSPVARLHPPKDVRVISIEHAEDPVAHLDGRSNPDRANWTTITAHVGHDDRVRHGKWDAAHSGALYTETAREIERRGLAQIPDEFTTTRGNGANATQFDYRLTRP